MTGIILAGGKNSRMGVDKAFLNINGKSIIDKTLAIYKSIFDEIIIVTNTPENYNCSGVKLIKDSIPGSGPLGGIYTGLSIANCEYCFVTACDMPFIDERVIRYIAGIDSYDVVVPVIKGKYEPLLSLYSRKGCIDIFRKQLDKGKLRIIDAFSGLKIKEVSEEEVIQFDAALLSIININTPEEFEKAAFMGKDLHLK